MAYVAPQTTTVLNSDLTALNGQITVLKGVRAAIPAGVNPRDIQLVDDQIKRLTKVVEIIQRRLKRAS